MRVAHVLPASVVSIQRVSHRPTAHRLNLFLNASQPLVMLASGRVSFDSLVPHPLQRLGLLLLLQNAQHNLPPQLPFITRRAAQAVISSIPALYVPSGHATHRSDVPAHRRRLMLAVAVASVLQPSCAGIWRLRLVSADATSTTSTHRAAWPALLRRLFVSRGPGLQLP